MEKIVIYGAGKRGKDVFELYNKDAIIVGFLDSDEKKQNTEYCGLKVFSPSEFSEKGLLVIVSIVGSHKVIKYLNDLGYKRVYEYDPKVYIDFESLSLFNESKYYEYGMPSGKLDNIESVKNYLADFDVISFDIFDTAIFRKVEYATDVFTLLGNIKKHHNYKKIRIEAERKARELRRCSHNDSEVSILDIYEVLNKYYGIPLQWMDCEIEIEKNICIQNPYIYDVYRYLLNEGKTIIFTSDMYLPLDVITEILEKNGYLNPKVYLSNDKSCGKCDGKLYEIIKKDFHNKKIVHIGDNWKGDVQQSKVHGLYSYYYPNTRFKFREFGLDTLDASFYRAVLSNNLNNGLWRENEYYTHGYRIGGILTAGYCDFINKFAADKEIEVILFCARDCKVIYEAYNMFYKKYSNEYIRISRKSALEIAGEQYFYELVNHEILQYIRNNSKNKVLKQLLIEAGFSYLCDIVKADGINIECLPEEIDNCIEKIKIIAYENKDIIMQELSQNIEAAKQYYKKILGNSKRVLIVDIGWSGTCIVALRQFLLENFSGLEVYGTLMCSTSNDVAINGYEQNIVGAYIHSVFHNRDLIDSEYVLPKESNIQVRAIDYLHLGLEFLFTSTDSSLMHYIRQDNGTLLQNAAYKPENIDEINQMQKGIVDFIKDYINYSKDYNISISPYVAYSPFMTSLNYKGYVASILGNFAYDLKDTPSEKRIIKYKDVL